LGARIGLTLHNGPEIYVFGRNLTDKRYISYAARLNAILAPLGISAPRTYGAGVRYRF
jgi:iron complex outermembrane receptor protein